MAQLSSNRPPESAAQDERAGVIWRGLIYGIGGLLVGAVFGLMIGANVGGNWVPGFSIGSLHGYEATAMLGALIGAVGAGVVSFWLTVRRHR